MRAHAHIHTCKRTFMYWCISIHFFSICYLLPSSLNPYEVPPSPSNKIMQCSRLRCRANPLAKPTLACTPAPAHTIPPTACPRCHWGTWLACYSPPNPLFHLRSKEGRGCPGRLWHSRFPVPRVGMTPLIGAAIVYFLTHLPPDAWTGSWGLLSLPLSPSLSFSAPLSCLSLSLFQCL